MEIRRYREHDRKQVIWVLQLNTPVYFSAGEEADLEDYLTHHIDRYYVIEIDEKICACGGLNLSENGEKMTISWDIVHPDWHGKGLGSALMKHRIQITQSIPSVTILSVRTSQLVYPFYEKFGLQIKEVIKDYWDEGFDMYRLECPIDSVVI
jgi:[ribosomal protein S18]-alanine N-acetyltransferase